jgi:hypothetical protein
MSLVLAKQLISTLPQGVPGLFNPWADICAFDAPTNGPEAKLTRLAAHLSCDPQFILCGEAPGYLGCRHSGIAFTSESLLLNGAIPRVPREISALTISDRPLKEQSATIVWKALYDLKIAEHVILWNAINLHPHLIANHRKNRTPSFAEVSLGKPAIEILLNAYPDARLIAVGRKAEELFTSMKISVHGCVRHPANGGAPEFRSGMAKLVS